MTPRLSDAQTPEIEHSPGEQSQSCFTCSQAGLGSTRCGHAARVGVNLHCRSPPPLHCNQRRSRILLVKQKLFYGVWQRQRGDQMEAVFAECSSHSHAAQIQQGPGDTWNAGEERQRQRKGGLIPFLPYRLRPEAGGDGRQDTPVLAASIPISEESWLW